VLVNVSVSVLGNGSWAGFYWRAPGDVDALNNYMVIHGGNAMTLDTNVLLPWAGTGAGLPWGVGTHMAQREAAGQQPWVTGCSVQTLIGGYAVMSAIRDQLEAMITAAQASPHAAGQRGFVYVTDWRMNGQRDLSDANSWGTGPWVVGTSTAAKDQTALGLLMRLIFAGVRVRVLLWLPVGHESLGSGDAHIHDHVWIAATVAAANRSAMASFAEAGQEVVGGSLGVVALDARVTQGTGSHHQKTVVMRGGPDMAGPDGQPIAMAFVGGVDLAFTRRDAPAAATTTAVQFQDGDWQSGKTIPAAGTSPPWPQGPAGDVDYDVLSGIPRLDQQQASDLYVDVYGDSGATSRRQIWHDQHLVISGPAVEIIEGQFIDRWMDAGNFQALPGDGTNLGKVAAKLDFGGVTLSAADEVLNATTLTAAPPEPEAVDPVPGGSSTVQLWRTISARARATGSAYEDHHALFTGGEFTVLAGYARAAAGAQHLIWIFDQYFWSLPYARLLNQLVTDPSKPDLNIIVILPAHADVSPGIPYTAEAQHRARREALDALVGTPPSPRVSVWDLWDRRSGRMQPGHGPGLGIYVHAKAHTYDGSLFVCGSANINRRSLTGDSEIACAVLDSSVVAQHQQDRWQLLFPGQPWPTDSSGQALDLDGSSATVGTAFHNAFRDAAAQPTSFLIPDQWTVQSPTGEYLATLPNGVERDAQLNGFLYDLLLNHALECTSLPKNTDAAVATASGTTRPATLADVAARIASRMAGQAGQK
jgi:hypothetical protein